jgi:hypothetical protein
MGTAIFFFNPIKEPLFAVISIKEFANTIAEKIVSFKFAPNKNKIILKAQAE